jgi:PKD repeat protein
MKTIMQTLKMMLMAAIICCGAISANAQGNFFLSGKIILSGSSGAGVPNWTINVVEILAPANTYSDTTDLDGLFDIVIPNGAIAFGPNKRWEVSVYDSCSMVLKKDTIQNSQGFVNSEYREYELNQCQKSICGIGWQHSVNNQAVTFTSSAFGAPNGSTRYFWNFGDGTTSTDKNPTHFYQPGSYGVCAWVISKSATNDYCINYFCNPVVVSPIGNPNPNCVSFEEQVITNNDRENAFNLYGNGNPGFLANWNVTNGTPSVYRNGFLNGVSAYDGSQYSLLSVCDIPNSSEGLSLIKNFEQGKTYEVTIAIRNYATNGNPTPLDIDFVLLKNKIAFTYQTQIGCTPTPSIPTDAITVKSITSFAQNSWQLVTFSISNLTSNYEHLWIRPKFSANAPLATTFLLFDNLCIEEINPQPCYTFEEQVITNNDREHAFNLYGNGNPGFLADWKVTNGTPSIYRNGDLSGVNAYNGNQYVLSGVCGAANSSEGLSLRRSFEPGKSYEVTIAIRNTRTGGNPTPLDIDFILLKNSIFYSYNNQTGCSATPAIPTDAITVKSITSFAQNSWQLVTFSITNLADNYGHLWIRSKFSANAPLTTTFLLFDNLCIQETTVNCNALQPNFTNQVSGALVSFTNQTQSAHPNDMQYTWNFGDNTSSNDVSPSHSYNLAGTYNVCLIAKDLVNNCVDSICKQVTTTTNLCTANFGYSYNALTLEAPATVIFTDSSVSSVPGTGITTWLWKVDGNNIATTQNPSYTFTSPGTYNVCLIITTSNSCTSDFCKQIVVLQPTCTTNFSYTVNANNEVQFEATNFSSVVSYQWSFGDGSSASGRTPIKTYAAPGTYFVCVSAAYSNGCTAQKCDSVIVNNIIITPPTCYSFEEQAITLSDREHAFNLYGNGNPGFLADWKVTNGTPSIYKNGDLSGVNAYDGNQFVLSGVCGAANSSEGLSLIRNFQQGKSYEVTIAIRNARTGGNPTPIDIDFILLKTPIAYTYNSQTGCSSTPSVPSNAVTVKSITSFAQNSWQLVTFTITNLTDTYEHLWIRNKLSANAPLLTTFFLFDALCIEELPVPTCEAAFTYNNNGINLTTVAFQNQSTSSSGIVAYSWNFGDGSPASNDANPTHTYAQYGTYYVCLVLTSSSGCGDSFCDSVEVRANPFGCEAAFQAIPVANNRVEIINNSVSDNPNSTSYVWLWGDNSTGSGLAPDHTYQAAGTYTICMYQYDAVSGCRDTLCKAVQVGNNTPTCNADFTYSPNNIPLVAPATVVLNDSSFSNTPGTGIATWIWKVNGTLVATTQNSSYIFTTPGTYNVCLAITTTNGCSDDVCKQIVVQDNSPACFSFEEQVITSNDREHAFNLYGDGNSGFLYDWYVVSGTPSLQRNGVISGVNAYDGNQYALTGVCNIANNWSEGLSLKKSFQQGKSYDVTIAIRNTGLNGGTPTPIDVAFVLLKDTIPFNYQTQTGCTQTPAIPSNGITVKSITSFAQNSWQLVTFNIPVLAENYEHLWIRNQFSAANAPLNTTLFLFDNLCIEEVLVSSCISFEDQVITQNDKEHAFNLYGDGNPGILEDWYVTSGTPSLQRNGFISGVNAYDGNQYALLGVCNIANNWSEGLSLKKSFQQGKSYDVTIAIRNTGLNGVTPNPIDVAFVLLKDTIPFNYNSQTGCTATPAIPSTAITVKSITSFAQNSWQLVTFNIPVLAENYEHLWIRNKLSANSPLTTTLFLFDNLCIQEAAPPACEAAFTFTNNGLNITTVTFDNNSVTNGAAQFVWTFGDGNSSSLENPMHTYAAQGQYLVCLKVYTATNCFDEYCQTIVVGNGGSNCEAKFVAQMSSISNLKFGFTNASVPNNPNSTTYSWSFGDGSGSQLANPVHEYATAGRYIVCLTVSDAQLQCQDTYCDTIFAGSQNNCDAAFAYSVNGSTVSFDNNSFPAFNTNSYFWNFGDNSFSNDANPSHTYSAPGTYNVCLTMIDNQNACTDVVCQTIVIGQNSSLFCISGKVFQGTPNSPAFPASVYLIYNDTALGTLTAIRFTTTNAQGGYEFCNVPQGRYLVKAALTPNSPVYANYVPTYYGNSLFWNYATQVLLTQNAQQIDIWLIAGNNQGGPGFVGGYVSQGANKMSPGDMLKDVQVMLLDIFDNPVQYIFSDEEGRWTFDNVAYGTYQVYAEVPGKETIPYIVTIGDEQPSVDDIMLYVETEQVISSISEVQNIFTTGISVFPNPFSSKINVETDLKQDANITFSITDVAGKVVVQETTTIIAGTNIHTINLLDYTAGIYLLKIEHEGFSKVVKLVKY